MDTITVRPSAGDGPLKWGYLAVTTPEGETTEEPISLEAYFALDDLLQSLATARAELRRCLDAEGPDEGRSYGALITIADLLGGEA